ncbi:MAG: hypothetical protein IT385_02975 [Deltaproteobacteria bacterium]|nr:hypothetical protein [Deltaproteobacteria bacterium]
MSARGAMLFIVVVACADDGSSGTDGDVTSSPDETGDTPSEVGDTTSEVDDTTSEVTPDVEPVDDWLDLVGRYNLLVTVAGRGQQRDEGVEWSPLYEGGEARACELSRPHMAMGDAAGNIYIADKEAHAVRRVSPVGVVTTVAGTNVPGDDGDEPGPGAERRLGNPNGLWVREDGVVFILDLDNGKVRRLAIDGTMTTLFAVPGGIDTGRGLWVADDEREAFVASGDEVLRWQADLGVSVYSRGFASLANLVKDPDGHLVVTDRGAHRVFRLDADGGATPIAGNGTTTGGGDGALATETGLDEPRAVWFRDSGGFFVGTHEGNQLWYVDAQGVIHLALDGGDNHAHGGDGLFFRAPGEKVSEVRAVTIDPLGRILVTENDYGYVRAILPAGWTGWPL